MNTVTPVVTRGARRNTSTGAPYPVCPVVIGGAVRDAALAGDNSMATIICCHASRERTLSRANTGFAVNFRRAIPDDGVVDGHPGCVGSGRAVLDRAFAGPQSVAAVIADSQVLKLTAPCIVCQNPVLSPTTDSSVTNA